jgi:formyltetrahydrofolate hydrolase
VVTRNQGNIVSLDQYSSDPTGGDFFQRVVFSRPDLTVALPEIEADLGAQILKLLEGNVDFVVLARYMQLNSSAQPRTTWPRILMRHGNQTIVF